MDISKQPGISFDNVILSKMDFSRSPIVEKPEIKVYFSSNATINEEKKKLALELSADVKETKNESFSLKCTMIGFFSVLEGQENLTLEEFSKVNAPALILPYLREVIANMTLRSGINPIILPPINIKSIIDTTTKSAKKV